MYFEYSLAAMIIPGFATIGIGIISSEGNIGIISNLLLLLGYYQKRALK